MGIEWLRTLVDLRHFRATGIFLRFQLIDELLKRYYQPPNKRSLVFVVSATDESYFFSYWYLYQRKNILDQYNTFVM